MASEKQRRIEQRRKRNKARKNFKTVITISLFTVLGLLAAGAGMFYFLTLKSMGTVVYPSSPLSKMMDASYSYVTSKDLPVAVSCPNIPISLSVSGEEVFINYNGTVFNYGNGMYISLYEVDSTPSQILNSQYGYDLCKGEPVGEPHFVLGLEDIGYFNGYPASYMCGDIQLMSSTSKPLQDIYVVTMTLDVDKASDLMVGVATADEKQLYDCGVLLQNICYTIMDISSSSSYVNTDDKVTESVVVQQEVINPPPAAPEPEVVEEAPAFDEQAPIDTSDWDSYTVTLRANAESADFILRYSEKDVTPSSVLLYSPTGEMFSPGYFNDGKDGRIYATVVSPGVGEWVFKVRTSSNLGNVSTSVKVAGEDEPEEVPTEETPAEGETPVGTAVEPTQTPATQ